MRIYKIDEQENNINVYTYINVERYNFKDNKIVEESGYGIPCKYILIKNNNEYKVIDYKVPRAGGLYQEDIKNIFPNDIVNKINNVEEDGTLNILKYNIQTEVRKYFNK